MDEEQHRQYQELLSRAGRAARLIENEDFRSYCATFDAEIRALYFALRDTTTTDPKIAKLQGKLKMLENVMSRPKEDIYAGKGAQMITTQDEDFNLG